MRPARTLLIACLVASCQSPAAQIAERDAPELRIVPHDANGADQVSSRQRAAAPVATKPDSRAGKTELTLEEAVQLALHWHPAIDEATGRIHQSDERIKAAKADYFPKISAGITSGYASTSKRGFEPRFSVSASQLIYDFGKVASAVDIQKANKAINQAQLLLATDDLARDTANAVIEVQRYRALTVLSQAQVDGVKAIAALVSQRSSQGASTMSDKVQADARVESALAAQWQYQSSFDQWRVTLAAMTGSDGALPVRAVPSWLDQACQQAAPDWSQVPVVLEAEAERSEADAQFKASRAEAFPTVSLEAETDYDLNGSGSVGGDPFSYSVGVNVSSSLYNGGQTSARNRAAAFALQSSQAAIRAARLDTERSLAEARSQIGALTRLASSLASRSDLMVKARDLYRQQYIELGTRTLLDLLNAEQELHDARLQIANATHDMRRLNITCLYSSGRMRQGFGIEAFDQRGKVQ